MDQFGLNTSLDFLQYFTEENLKKSWSPAKITERDVLGIDDLQSFDCTRSGRSYNGMTWISSEADVDIVRRNRLVAGPKTTSILDVTGNNYMEFAKNGIESDLDEFDMYQTRLRSLAVDDKIFQSGTEQKNIRLSYTKIPKNTVCVFCKNNKETLSVYGTHTLKDSMGRVTCPILRRYTCPICGCSGDRAHTIKYCPFNLACEGNDALLRSPRNSAGKKRRP